MRVGWSQGHQGTENPCSTPLREGEKRHFAGKAPEPEGGIQQALPTGWLRGCYCEMLRKTKMWWCSGVRACRYGTEGREPRALDAGRTGASVRSSFLSQHAHNLLLRFPALLPTSARSAGRLFTEAQASFHKQHIFKYGHPWGKIIISGELVYTRLYGNDFLFWTVFWGGGMLKGQGPVEEPWPARAYEV